MEKVFIVYLAFGVLFSLILLENGKSLAKVYVLSCHHIINYPCNAKSNQNFNTPPGGKTRAFDYFLCPGSGEFDG